jgi:hypothetical protein
VRLDDFVVSVVPWGQHFRDEPDLCQACLIEIAKKGVAFQRVTLLDSLSSPLSKKEGE